MRLIGVVLALVLTASLAAEGQPAPKIPKIGLLTLATPAAAAPLVEAFRQELSAGSMSPAPIRHPQVRRFDEQNQSSWSSARVARGSA
jgi:hypothetical protein